MCFLCVCVFFFCVFFGRGGGEIKVWIFLRGHHITGLFWGHFYTFKSFFLRSRYKSEYFSGAGTNIVWGMHHREHGVKQRLWHICFAI